MVLKTNASLSKLLTLLAAAHGIESDGVRLNRTDGGLMDTVQITHDEAIGLVGVPGAIRIVIHPTLHGNEAALVRLDLEHGADFAGGSHGDAPFVLHAAGGGDDGHGEVGLAEARDDSGNSLAAGDTITGTPAILTVGEGGVFLLNVKLICVNRARASIV